MSVAFQLVFDTADPVRQAEFWSAALGYKLQDPPDGFASWDDALRAWGVPEERWGDSSAIVDPDGVRPRIYFQLVPEGKTAKNRLHIDLNVGGPVGTSLEDRKARIAAEVGRLKALGATDDRGAIEQEGEYWVRMNDPEGNEFCVQ